MKITCPRCGFSREMSSDRVPARAVIATCPHCACRFRFVSETDEESPRSEQHVITSAKPRTAAKASQPTPPPPPSGETAYEDDPLPPGAIIPGGPFPHQQKDFSEQGDKVSRGSLGLGGEEEGDLSLSKQNSSKVETEETGSFKSHAVRNDETFRSSQESAFNPWESAPGADGWIASFYHTCLRVMFGAQQFFGGLRPDTPQSRALLFYLIVSVVQVVVEWMWTGVFLALVGPDTTSDPELSKLLEMLSSQSGMPLLVLLKTGLAVAQLYILSTLLQFFYGFVAKSRPEFSRIFQIVAYAAAPSLLCIVPLLGSIAGFIWMLACLLVGLRASMRLSWAQTVTGFLPVVVLFAPLLLQLVKAAQG
ncbi:MAG: YIP1 family protein [Desulfovibrio sp.]|nr:YIP1 family protein [Desulfovibrio sp.]